MLLVDLEKKPPQNSTSQVATSSLTRKHSDSTPGLPPGPPARRLEGRVLAGECQAEVQAGQIRGEKQRRTKESSPRSGFTERVCLRAFTRLHCYKYWRGKGGGREGGERKAGHYFPSLCQKRTRKTQKHPVPRHLLGPTAQATRGQRRRPARLLPLTGAGRPALSPCRASSSACSCPTLLEGARPWRSCQPKAVSARSGPTSASCPRCLYKSQC